MGNFLQRAAVSEKSFFLLAGPRLLLSQYPAELVMVGLREKISKLHVRYVLRQQGR